MKFVKQRAVLYSVLSEAFTGQYTEVWNEVGWISGLHNISLLHVFDNHIENIIYRIWADILDISIFLLPNISIGTGPKNPISVRP